MSQKHEPDFDRGTVRYLASELEIPPRLAEAGGATAAAAMAELKKAHIAGSGMMRANHVAAAQKHIAALDPRRHGDLLQHLQAIVVTLGGTPQRTELAHVTTGEIVIPAELRTPELMAALRAVAEAQGIDLERYLVGSRRNSVNPKTGRSEFFEPGFDPRPGWVPPDPNAGDEEEDMPPIPETPHNPIKDLAGWISGIIVKHQIEEEKKHPPPPRAVDSPGQRG